MKPIRGLWRLWTNTRMIGVVMIVLALVSGVSVYIQNERTNAITECVAAYTAGFAAALDARTDGQALYNSTFDQLITSVFTATSPGDGRRAYEQYVIAKRERDEALRANPYPDPRSAVCT